MENNTGLNNLMKSRSIGACIKSGYTLYIDNFKSIFKTSWSAALLYSIVCSIIGTIGVIRMPAVVVKILTDITHTTLNLDSYYGLVAIMFALVIFGGIVETVFYSYGMSLLRTHGSTDAIITPKKLFFFDKHTAWRTIKATASCLLISALPTIIFVLFFHYRLRFVLAEPGSHIPTLSVTAIIIIAIVLLMLPLCFIFMKYIIRDETRFWSLLAKEYIPGLQHLPLILAIMFVNIVVIAFACYVIQQPAVILFIANTQANFGTLYGDSLGMPGYIVPMTAFVFLLAGFIQAYIRMSALFTLYYMYGSIETQKTEREQYRKRRMETQKQETIHI